MQLFYKFWKRSNFPPASGPPFKVQGSFISHYLHKVTIERKVELQHMITRYNNYKTSYKNVYGGQSSKGFLVKKDKLSKRKKGNI